ncbi:uncharacterized protein LOC126895300 isoform X2 [Daktulosphaira vitifoliae]|uniref:uncharacterized protein LOC126895300 isoform X2 n=1 Tax=Daktulosphaira vitifoliae TaxID=58002 RepID=UPI0021AA4E40|nr:uncharacterized protein LOC126895300 isoform X2 [Daktulosphaira vitifoliae]
MFSNVTFILINFFTLSVITSSIKCAHQTTPVQRSNKIIPEHTPKNQESKKHLLELAPMENERKISMTESALLNNGKIQPGYNNVDDLCGNSRPATEYPNENTLEPTYSSDHVTGHGRNISYSTSDYRTSSYSTSSFDNYDGMI